MQPKLLFAAFASSPILPLTAGAIAVGIFLIDTITTLDIAIAVLYVVVVLMAANFLPRRGVLLVSSACLILTVLSYLLSHGLTADTALVRCLVSLSAIGISTVLALKNQSAQLILLEQAQLLDLTHDTIFVRDMNDVITYWNRGAAELYGWSGREAIGKICHELLQTIFPVPLEEITSELLRTDRWEGELVHAKRGGTQVVVSSRWSLQRNERGQPVAILETNTDITERKRAEDAQRRSEAYLAEAQRLSRTGSFAWKLGSGEIVWSKETYRIMDVDQTAKPTIDLILQNVHPDDRQIVQREIDRALQGEQEYDYEHRLRPPDGAVKHLHVRARRIKYQSGEEEIVGAVVDVTAVKQAQEALHEAQAGLAHITRVTTLGEMTASIAHEVNQPLAGIVTNGEASLRWLDRGVPDIDEARRAVRRIISDADRASNVIRRIRDLSKKATPEMARLDINGVIDEAISLVQRQALSRRVALRLQLAPGLPDVLGDRVQLQQVIINLAINGIEAMEHVSNRQRELVVRSQLYEGDQVLVAVRDCGVGIEPENANRMFSAFYTTKPDGMGMGLSICRSIIEAHGGRIWATSNDGPGATIQFAVPQYRKVERRPHSLDT